jgi:PncC family amidohydrolase
VNIHSDALQVYEHDIEHLRGLLANFLINHGLQLATAESCTGGLIAATCTDLAGSSAWLERGFVTYSNTAKTEMLGVDAALIARDGAVSESVVRAMAQGALAHSHAQVAVAVTGSGPRAQPRCRWAQCGLAGPRPAVWSARCALLATAPRCAKPRCTMRWGGWWLLQAETP